MSWKQYAGLLIGGREKDTNKPYAGLFGTGGDFDTGTSLNTLSGLMGVINQYQQGQITINQLEHMSDVYFAKAGGFKLTKALLRVRRNTIEYERSTALVDSLDRYIHKFGSSRARMAKAGIDLSDSDPGAIPMVIATALVGGQAEAEYNINLSSDLRQFNEVTIPKHMAKMKQISARAQGEIYDLQAKSAEKQLWINTVAQTSGSIASSLAGGGGGIKIQ